MSFPHPFSITTIPLAQHRFAVKKENEFASLLHIIWLFYLLPLSLLRIACYSSIHCFNYSTRKSPELHQQLTPKAFFSTQTDSIRQNPRPIFFFSDISEKTNNPQHANSYTNTHHPSSPPIRNASVYPTSMSRSHRHSCFLHHSGAHTSFRPTITRDA